MQDLFTLIVRNCLRHKLRSALTVAGIVVALLAFTIIRTMIHAWYSGVEASAKNRLVVRNAVSLVFYLPLSYKQTIAHIPGVTRIGGANWFGGVYRDEKFRFAQFAIDEDYLDVYPEFTLTPAERQAFDADRTGAIVGQDLVDRFGFKVGDVIQLQGSIFPGLWQFTIRGIFRSSNTNKVTRTMFFHWDYLNERSRVEQIRQPDQIGYFAVQIASNADPALVSKAIDQQFANSFAETLTETETAFQQSFVSMSSTIIVALRAVSLVVIVIMLLVLTNTLLMSWRERIREYFILRSLGFGHGRIAALVVGEAGLLGILGFALLSLILAVIFSLPPRSILGDLMDFFPTFRLEVSSVVYAFVACILTALIASAPPLIGMRRMGTTQGLRLLT